MCPMALSFVSFGRVVLVGLHLQCFGMMITTMAPQGLQRENCRTGIW